MGCDIHFYVETRNKKGNWKSADNWLFDNQGGRQLYGVINKKWINNSFYDARNYQFFAILAGVRNYDDITPIDSPRGVPDNASPEYKEIVQLYNHDGHSHSYFTVAELLAYDWTQDFCCSGVVNLKEWTKFKLNGRPESWSRGILGNKVQQLSPEELDNAWSKMKGASLWDLQRDEVVQQRFKDLLGASDKSIYCSVTWKEHYYDCASSFWSKTIPRLLALGKPEDVRCVFFFDN